MGCFGICLWGYLFGFGFLFIWRNGVGFVFESDFVFVETIVCGLGVG